jgi:hypothetical protein
VLRGLLSGRAIVSEAPFGTLEAVQRDRLDLREAISVQPFTGRDVIEDEPTGFAVGRIGLVEEYVEH